eukprot:23749_6
MTSGTKKTRREKEKHRSVTLVYYLNLPRYNCYHLAQKTRFCTVISKSVDNALIKAIYLSPNLLFKVLLQSATKEREAKIKTSKWLS